jgi:hypothetical protein
MKIKTHSEMIKIQLETKKKLALSGHFFTKIFHHYLVNKLSEGWPHKNIYSVREITNSFKSVFIIMIINKKQN